MTERTIYGTDARGIWTGESRVIGPEEGRLPNWIPVEPPTAPDGKVVRWDGESWTVEDLPPPAVPASVSMRQARLALLGAGLLDHVDVAIASLEEPNKAAATIEWEYATEMTRDHYLINILGQALGLDDAAIDDLFRAAAAIE